MYPLFMLLAGKFRRLRNTKIQKLISKTSRGDSYKAAIGEFFGTKSKLNADIRTAADVLDRAVSAQSSKQKFVNDWKVLSLSESRMQVQSTSGTNFEALNLATNSYNDLDTESETRDSLASYIKSDGILSSCLSRKIAGEVPAHRSLQNLISEVLGYESSILATCGYIAQQATLFGLFSEGDVIFSDQHNHSSLVDGMRLSKAKIIVYPHLDYESLEVLMAAHRKSYNCAGIVTDGVFSAHGTIANMDKISLLQRKYNAISVVDDTHGFLATGSLGRGILDHFDSRPDVLTASLAKGLAGFGGLIAGSRPMVRAIDCLGRQNINTSHLSPILAAQGEINLRFFLEHREKLVRELKEVVQIFHTELSKFGISPYGSTGFMHPIFSFCGESEDQVIDAFKVLLSEGFMGAFFPPPVSPKPTIRFSLHRKIPHSELIRLAQLLFKLKLTPLSGHVESKSNRSGVA